MQLWTYQKAGWSITTGKWQPGLSEYAGKEGYDEAILRLDKLLETDQFLWCWQEKDKEGHWLRRVEWVLKVPFGSWVAIVDKLI